MTIDSNLLQAVEGPKTGMWRAGTHATNRREANQ